MHAWNTYKTCLYNHMHAWNAYRTYLHNCIHMHEMCTTCIAQSYAHSEKHQKEFKMHITMSFVHKLYTKTHACNMRSIENAHGHTVTHLHTHARHTNVCMTWHAHTRVHMWIVFTISSPFSGWKTVRTCPRPTVAWDAPYSPPTCNHIHHTSYTWVLCVYGTMCTHTYTQS